MEKIEYDPEGGNYLPVTEHETGATLLVVGIVMLLGALGWLLYLGWDLRAGGGLMQIIFTTDVVIALVLMTWGLVKKRRQRT